MEGGNHCSSGLVWPQRNYTCSFCKRQFNSAQALGGHMNVHRRDRAMLIQLPSWVFDHQSPNPNPNSSSKSQPSPNFSSSNRHCIHQYQYPFHHSSSSSLSPASASLSSSSFGDKFSSNQIESCVPNLYEDLTMKRKNQVVEAGEFKKDYFGQEIEVLEQNHHEVISLDLEIGCKDSKEVLDLELRLGCF